MHDNIDKLIVNQAHDVYLHILQQLLDKGEVSSNDAEDEAIIHMNKTIEKDRLARIEFNDDPYFLLWWRVSLSKEAKDALFNLRTIGITDNTLKNEILRYYRQYNPPIAIVAHLNRYYTKLLARRYWQERLMVPMAVSAATSVIVMIIGSLFKGCQAS